MSEYMGEQLVGAWLQHVEKCEIVNFNLRFPETGLANMGEFDVVAMNLKDSRVYLCEVATHTGGLNYGKSREKTVAKIRQKFISQKRYAEQYLSMFDERRYMFWAPYVPRGFLTESLEAIDGLEIVINGEYKRRTEDVEELAATSKKISGNPAFRLMQILASRKSF